MEMTFPHHVQRQDSARSRIVQETILSVVAARQANSQTVRALRQAENATPVQTGDDIERIHYFAHRDERIMAVRGAFWKISENKSTCEPDVYQAALVDIKQQHLDSDATGEQLNHAGHGALRKL